VPSLKALHEAGHEIQLVITQPTRPGHRMKPAPPPVKVAADALGLVVIQPERIKASEVEARLRRLAPDLLVVVAYGQIIPRSLLSIPRLGAVNVHASLLPRHRGAAPVAHAILVGDRETGVTIMRMDEQLDHGPVLARSEVVRIGETEDAVALTARLALLGAEALVVVVNQLESIKPVEQNHEAATIAPRLRKEDGVLEWGMGAREIDRRVRGLQPWPGATLPTKRGRVKVLSGHIEGDSYVPDIVQLPGKKPAPAKQVLGDA
jgi:methionyl-tRNA formyltransferase